MAEPLAAAARRATWFALILTFAYSAFSFSDRVRRTSDADSIPSGHALCCFYIICSKIIGSQSDAHHLPHIAEAE